MATRNASLSSPQWGRCLASRAMMVASGTASVWTAQHFQAQQHVPFDVLLGKQVRGEKRMGLLLTEHARAHVWTSAVITVFDCCTPSLVRCCLSMSQGRQHLQDGRLCAWGAAEVECRALCRSATSSKSFVLRPTNAIID